MNYGYNKEKGTRIPIEYVCRDCSFTTFEQSKEKQHYEYGHYLSSEMRVDLEELDPGNTVSNSHRKGGAENEK